MPTYWGGVEVMRTSTLFVDSDINLDGNDLILGTGSILTTYLKLYEASEYTMTIKDITGAFERFFRSRIEAIDIVEAAAGAGVAIDGLQIKDGSVRGFDALTDADADNDTLYKASDHADVLYYKDSGGTCHALW